MISGDGPGCTLKALVEWRVGRIINIFEEHIYVVSCKAGMQLSKYKRAANEKKAYWMFHAHVL